MEKHNSPGGEAEALLSELKTLKASVGVCVKQCSTTLSYCQTALESKKHIIPGVGAIDMTRLVIKMNNTGYFNRAFPDVQAKVKAMLTLLEKELAIKNRPSNQVEKRSVDCGNFVDTEKIKHFKQSFSGTCPKHLSALDN